MDDYSKVLARPKVDGPDFAVEFRPPKELQVALSHPDRSTLCGGRFSIEASSAHPLVMYCYRPNCITTGTCTGPRFVPSLPLMERSAILKDEDGLPLRTPRPMPKPKTAESRRLMAEMVFASRAAARAALGKDDTRPDNEIALDIGLVWAKAAEGARGGGWGPGPDGV
jgi:hypothetical protein